VRHCSAGGGAGGSAERVSICRESEPRHTRNGTNTHSNMCGRNGNASTSTHRPLLEHARVPTCRTRRPSPSSRARPWQAQLRFCRPALKPRPHPRRTRTPGAAPSGRWARYYYFYYYYYYYCQLAASAASALPSRLSAPSAPPRPRRRLLLSPRPQLWACPCAARGGARPSSPGGWSTWPRPRQGRLRSMSTGRRSGLSARRSRCRGSPANMMGVQDGGAGGWGCRSSRVNIMPRPQALTTAVHPH
jgi:hypothetical protein